jgi:hypothetical protein
MASRTPATSFEMRAVVPQKLLVNLAEDADVQLSLRNLEQRARTRAISELTSDGRAASLEALSWMQMGAQEAALWREEGTRGRGDARTRVGKRT